MSDSSCGKKRKRDIHQSRKRVFLVIEALGVCFSDDFDVFALLSNYHLYKQKETCIFANTRESCALLSRIVANHEWRLTR